MLPTLLGIFVATLLVYGLLGRDWKYALVAAAILTAVGAGAGVVFGDLWIERGAEGVRMCSGGSAETTGRLRRLR
jgi:hypothetical protein